MENMARKEGGAERITHKNPEQMESTRWETEDEMAR